MGDEQTELAGGMSGDEHRLWTAGRRGGETEVPGDEHHLSEEPGVGGRACQLAQAESRWGGGSCAAFSH